MKIAYHQAAERYAVGDLSLGEAAEMFDISRMELLYELERREYPMMEGITDEQIEANFQRLLTRYRKHAAKIA